VLPPVFGPEPHGEKMASDGGIRHGSLKHVRQLNEEHDVTVPSEVFIISLEKTWCQVDGVTGIEQYHQPDNSVSQRLEIVSRIGIVIWSLKPSAIVLAFASAMNMKEKIRVVADKRHSRVWAAPFRNSVNSAHQLNVTSINMDRDSLDRSSSELAVDPASFNSSATNSGNDPALGGDSPKGQQFPGPANDPSPAVENVLQSDVGSILPLHA